MVTPTYAAFLANKIIVRIYGGLSGSGTHDDIVRHMLDCMGHVHLVESEEAKQNLIRFGEEEFRIFVTGITHLDDITLDTSLCLPEYMPYAILLMNPTTISRDETVRETQLALGSAQSFALQTGDVFVFPPNGDAYSANIEEMERAFDNHPRFHFYKERLPRNQFLGFLSKCSLLISNSSLTVYEAPALGVENVYNPSWRNQERTKPPALKAGGSDAIVKVLKEFDWSRPDLLRKRFRY
jgi:UDP-N-acetylglucosamine 2-epimerase